jgi:hypothetical protein
MAGSFPSFRSAAPATPGGLPGAGAEEWAVSAGGVHLEPAETLHVMEVAPAAWTPLSGGDTGGGGGGGGGGDAAPIFTRAFRQLSRGAVLAIARGGGPPPVFGRWRSGPAATKPVHGPATPSSHPPLGLRDLLHAVGPGDADAADEWLGPDAAVSAAAAAAAAADIGGGRASVLVRTGCILVSLTGIRVLITPDRALLFVDAGADAALEAFMAALTQSAGGGGGGGGGAGGPADADQPTLPTGATPLTPFTPFAGGTRGIAGAGPPPTPAEPGTSAGAGAGPGPDHDNQHHHHAAAAAAAGHHAPLSFELHALTAALRCASAALADAVDAVAATVVAQVTTARRGAPTDATAGRLADAEADVASTLRGAEAVHAALLDALEEGRDLAAMPLSTPRTITVPVGGDAGGDAAGGPGGVNAGGADAGSAGGSGTRDGAGSGGAPPGAGGGPPSPLQLPRNARTVASAAAAAARASVAARHAAAAASTQALAAVIARALSEGSVSGAAMAASALPPPASPGGAPAPPRKLRFPSTGGAPGDAAGAAASAPDAAVATAVLEALASAGPLVVDAENPEWRREVAAAADALEYAEGEAEHAVGRARLLAAVLAAERRRIALALAASRNRLLLIQIGVQAATAGIGVAGLVAGFFGMNLDSGVAQGEPSRLAFAAAVGVSVVAALSITGALYSLAARTAGSDDGGGGRRLCGGRNGAAAGDDGGGAGARGGPRRRRWAGRV